MTMKADTQFLTVDTSGSESGTPNPINADTLNGKPASDYVLKNELYPVGSIYISMNSTDPSNYFGGVWQRIKKAFLFAADDESYIAGSTGGEETHTLTVQEMPSHVHAFNDYWGVPSGTEKGKAGSYNSSGNTGGSTAYTGGSQPHNNMPPYLVVYIWQRMS